MSVLFHDRDKLHAGSVFKYRIEVEARPGLDLYINVSNRAVAPMRAAYLAGPYTLYADVVPMDYSEFVKTAPSSVPQYENHIKAGGHEVFHVSTRHPVQKYEVLVSSEILFTRGAEIGFDFVIATSKEQALVTNQTKLKTQSETDPRVAKMRVSKQNTLNLWQQPLPKPDAPLHLCVLTHGLVSNVTADLLYMKEAIDRAASITGENIVCKGYTGNCCRTEHGVKYLGKRLALWLQNELIPTYKPARMSFIGHSLGGLVQTYALGYLQAHNPALFSGIELENFVTLASPYLGVASENPGYVQFVLDFGFVGKTGRDLGLSWSFGKRPLLERLPNKHTRRILRAFKRRTLYANATNDGIVPLRTAALLYLDYWALASVQKAETSNTNAKNKHADAVKRERTSKGQELLVKTLDTLLPDKKSKIARFQTTSVTKQPDMAVVAERLPKKTSIIESGMSLLLPPHPDTDFITDPAARGPVVFHDRVYYEHDLPPRRFKSSILNKGEVESSRTEERIARKYHRRMSWRKVLVHLAPEAHNNIVVRRRFSNAYGWPVLNHMVCEHFIVKESVGDNLLGLNINKRADMDLSRAHPGEIPRKPDAPDAPVEEFVCVDSASSSMSWSCSEESEKGAHIDPHRPSMFRILKR